MKHHKTSHLINGTEIYREQSQERHSANQKLLTMNRNRRSEYGSLLNIRDTHVETRNTGYLH